MKPEIDDIVKIGSDRPTIWNIRRPDGVDRYFDETSTDSHSHPQQFPLVNNKDDGDTLVLIGDCLPQKEKKEPFVCFYTAHFAGAFSKTFLGGGIYSGATSDEVADNFLASVAQDVVERWSNTVRENAVEGLESCLFLTQCSCKVPKILTAKLKADVVNLSQYLQKGGLKK